MNFHADGVMTINGKATPGEPTIDMVNSATS